MSVHSVVHMQVPSLSEVTQGNVEQHLEWIYNEIPIFRLLGETVLVEKEKLVDNQLGFINNTLYGSSTN